MNNLAKITLENDVMASRLYDGLQDESSNGNTHTQASTEETGEKNMKKKKFSFKIKKPIFKVKNSPNFWHSFNITPGVKV